VVVWFDCHWKAWEQVVESGYEGLVAKEEASGYEGGPTRRWLKVKVSGRTDPEGPLAAADQRFVGASRRAPKISLIRSSTGLRSSRTRSAKVLCLSVRSSKPFALTAMSR
jgi:hypothetical protein